VKIGNPSELFRSGAPAGSAVPPEAEKAKAAATASQPVKEEGSATVKLSGGLAKLSAEVNTDEAFDAKRVEALKAAIDNGSFKVNAEVVASKVISSNVEALTRAVP
jgi:negative regulator of flagellin synthesis FlgM